MFGYLNGKITYKSPTYVYIECGGVGYHVNISLNTFSKLEGKVEVKIFTVLQVREDDMSLYGFYEEDERFLFTNLISVSGVGANTARVILSYMTVEEVRRAIVHNDAASLSKVKGIGAKTAQKIIIDLKEKIVKSSGGVDSISISGGQNNIVREDALFALVALGFPKAAIEKTINNILLKNPDVAQVEDLIKLVLKQMN